jgi:hypothetical protein
MASGGTWIFRNTISRCPRNKLLISRQTFRAQSRLAHVAASDSDHGIYETSFRGRPQPPGDFRRKLEVDYQTAGQRKIILRLREKLRV